MCCASLFWADRLRRLPPIIERYGGRMAPRSLLLAASTADAGVMAVLAAYVAEHYASPLRMADLARHCHVSVRTLQNLCHAHCGEAPLKALRRFRLQKLHGQIHSRPWTPLRQHYAAPALPRFRPHWIAGGSRSVSGDVWLHGA